MAAHQRKPELGSIHTGLSAGIGFDIVTEDRPAISGGGQENEIEMGANDNSDKGNFCSMIT